MSNKTIHSNQITFIDYTDSRKLDVYINSNLPTTQNYNVNTSVYSPDWSTTNLELTSNIYLDSNEITTDAQTSIRWYKKIGSGTNSQISTGASLTVSTNELSGDNTFITYTCEATYQNITSFCKMVFMRADTGVNGIDGTSVDIKGIAYYDGELTQSSIGQTVSLYSDQECTTILSTTGLSVGDGYMAQGYLCMYDETNFTCLGLIQGPKGDNAKNIILGANNKVFRVNKSNIISPEIITITAQAINTVITEWSYSTDGGQNFSSTVPSGVVRSGYTITVTGASMTANMIVIKASDGIYNDVFTITKVFDGADGAQGNSAPNVFLSNDNIVFVADSFGRITATSATTNIIAYNGLTKVTPTIGIISGLPTGITIDTDEIITINNELILTFDISNNTTLGSELSNNGTISIPILTPISTILYLNWSKINEGVKGADAYNILLSTESYIFPCDNNGNISAPVSITTTPIVYQGSESVAFTIGTLPIVNGLTLGQTDGVITIQANTGSVLSDTGTLTIPIIVNGVIFNRSFSWAKVRNGASTIPSFRRGTCLLNSISTTNVTFSSVMDGNPTVILTPMTDSDEAISGNILQVTNSGFSAKMGGEISGNIQFAYIAMYD